MSSRSKRASKTSSVTRTSRETVASPGPSTPIASSTMISHSSSTTTSPRSPRSSSPNVFSRKMEKDVLASLNDRLAAYIDKVRSLETDNEKLIRRIQTFEETSTSEKSNIKAAYENELAEVRKLLDETCKDKAKLQVEVNKLQTENKDLRDKYTNADRDLKVCERKLIAAESQVSDLQARLSDAVNQRKHWENEYHKVRKELDDTKKMLDKDRAKLEEETIQRVDLQNRVQSLKEELAFKQQVFDQELNETKTRSRVEYEEVDARVQQDYDSRLQEALAEMREENEENVRNTRSEAEAMFTARLNQMRDLINASEGDTDRYRSEVSVYKKRIDALAGDVRRLEGLNIQLDNRVKELEDQLSREQAEHSASIDARDAEIRRLRLALEDQMTEYKDLLDIKIQLDTELAAYRRLLESEETRLNISSASEATPSRSYSRRTPMRATATGSRKRKRTDQGGSLLSTAQSSSGYASTSSSKGPIEIAETDEEGRYIKLFNSGEQDMSLGGWQLKHVAGEQEAVYKFHRSLHLKPNTYCTVWSSDSETTHSPPSDLVMKNQKWSISDTMTSTLINSTGEDYATREMSKSYMRTTYTRTSDETIEGDPQRREQCVVM